MTLSVVVPTFDDKGEAIELCNRVCTQLNGYVQTEQIIVVLDPVRATSRYAGHSPPFMTIIQSDGYCPLPKGKNLALRSSHSEHILFLAPGIDPGHDAVMRLVSQLRRHPDWGGVAGRWDSIAGEVEIGYNVRRYPSFLALLYDLLFINKIFPGNRTTRNYKMHDFDYKTVIQADHVLDYAFMADRRLLLELGGFNDSYRFGWFDQLEMCRKMNDFGRKVYYDPGAVFTSTDREVLLNRILAYQYTDFYVDQMRFVKEKFGPWRSHLFNAVLGIGMIVRLVFARLPSRVRIGLLRRYRSYVDDDYIRQMHDNYRRLLEILLTAGKEVS
jgi:GT2 family glycosyltransferase